MTPIESKERVTTSLKSRNRNERRFKLAGMIAIASALAFLVLLFAGILLKGIPGMFQHYVTVDVILDKERLDPSGEMTRESLSLGDFDGVIKDSVYDTLGGVTGRKAKRAARKIVS